MATKEMPSADEKVVIKTRLLQGSQHPEYLQRIAVVYIRGEEYRVSAPPEARGDALDWVKHWSVREAAREWYQSGETETEGSVRVLVIKLVQEELEKEKALEPGSTGMHPDGEHCSAQVCVSGHVHYCDGHTFKSGEYCKECGAAYVDACRHCKEPIRGAEIHETSANYQRPSFCHACGRPYPWMEGRLKTARELLEHDDKLTENDREALWPDLQFVMSNPKDGLVPAKKKLIEINLGKATDWVREAVLDLVAKTIAESMKG